MPFTSNNINHKAFSVKKLTESDIQTLIDLKYPMDSDILPVTYVDLCAYILNTYDMQISVANLHTFIKKQRQKKRIQNAKDALVEVQKSKIINSSNIDDVINNIGGILISIAEDQGNVTGFTSIVGALVKWKEATIKERDLALRERVQSEGANVNVRTNVTPSREVLDQLSREIGLL